MLTEEALILLATIGASGLLVLGVVELIWPARPLHGALPRGRVATTSGVLARRLEPARVMASDAPAVAEEAAPASMVPPAALSAEATVEEPSAIATAEVDTPATPEPVVAEPEHTVEPTAAPVVLPAAPAPPRSAGETRPHVLPIETCRTMYDEGRFAEVVSLGSAALEVHAGLAAMSHRHDEASAVLDLVGLAKRQLGDLPGACAALRAAVQGAPLGERPVYVSHLREVVGALAEPGARAGEDRVRRVRELRTGLAALEGATAGTPDDESVPIAAKVREALAAACDSLAADAAARSGADEGRTLLLEVLGDAEMPSAWRDRVRDQLTAASSAEIGQLTAQAIRCVQDGRDDDALHALDRAERLSQALPAGTVTDERREEIERRLWWGYSKVGVRGIETRRFDQALEPLFRALRFSGGDEERAVETRGALVRALEGVIEAAAPDIVQGSAADPRAARAKLDALHGVVRAAGERGITADERDALVASLTELGASVPAARS